MSSSSYSKRQRGFIKAQISFILAISFFAVGSAAGGAMLAQNASPEDLVRGAKLAFITASENTKNISASVSNSIPEIRINNSILNDFYSATQNTATKLSYLFSTFSKTLSNLSLTIPKYNNELNYASPSLAMEVTTQEEIVEDSSASTTTINYITQPVIERIVYEQAPATTDAATQSWVASLITTLENRLALQIASIPRTSGGGAGNPIYNNTIGLTQKIDQLSNVTLSGVTGLTDSDIPDDITASNYLPISGGTLTGDLTLTNATSTNFFSTLLRATTGIIDSILTANTIYATNATTTRLDVIEYLAVGGTATTTIRGDGTASTISYASSTAISVSGNAYFPNSGIWNSDGNLGLGSSNYINWGATLGTSGYGFRDNGGTLQVKNSGGSWTNIPTSGTTQWTTTGDDIYYTTGNTSLGTTTASSKLSIYGDLFLEGTDRYLNFGTATGSGSYGIRDNSGTIQFKNSGGSWASIPTGASAGNPSFIFSTSTAGSGTVNFNGPQGAAPSFSGGVLTLPSDTQTMVIELVGAGGGGGGSGSSNSTAGGNGGNSTFGTALLVANGGAGASGGTTGIAPGTGGTASLGGLQGVAITGGGGGGEGLSNASGLASAGGVGGSSYFGGGGAGTAALVNGVAGAAGTGGGGSGGGGVGPGVPGGGGGAGGYVRAVIASPDSSYSYTIGAGGTAGAAGAGGYAGGAGGSGTMIITVYAASNSTANGVASSSVAFSVHKNGTSQTVTDGVNTKLTWSTEVFDTNNNFDLSTDRFTPTVAGYYLVNLTTYCPTGTQDQCAPQIWKNGSLSHQGKNRGGGEVVQNMTSLEYMNGVSDYLEAYVLVDVTSGTPLVSGVSTYTFFSGALIAPSNGLAGGWSNDNTQSYLADITDKVGIGTSTPFSKLAVQNSYGDGLTSLFSIASSTSADGSTADTLLTVTNAGNVRIGTTTSTYGGRVTSYSASSWTYESHRTGTGNEGHIVFENGNGAVGTITTNGSATSYNTSSDRRVKENIVDTELGLETLLKLPVRDFSFIADETHSITTGFIAQELYEVFPDAVTTNGDNGIDPLSTSTSPWAVDYGRITPIIVKAIQDLYALITSVQEAIASITERLMGYDAKLASLEERLAALENSQTASASEAGDSSSDSNADTTPPTITINGNNPANVSIGATYNDLGATVTDNRDVNLGITLKLGTTTVDSITIDTSEEATYTITYMATDNSGNTTEVTREVIVGNSAEEDAEGDQSTENEEDNTEDATDTEQIEEEVTEDTSTSEEEGVNTDSSTEEENDTATGGAEEGSDAGAEDSTEGDISSENATSTPETS